MSGVVLVAGGAGYIGSHVVLELMEIGYRPVVIDNLSTGVRDAVPDQVSFYQIDVADEAAVLGVFDRERPGAVMHFAGSIVVPDSVTDPIGYYSNNTAASLSLIRAAVRSRVEAFVFSSTAAVYGEPIAHPVAEDCETRPLSPYGWSKLMTEQILRDAASAHSAFRPVSLRYFNVAGADGDRRAGQRGHQVTHLVRVALDVALGRRPHIEVYGTDYPTPDGTCVRDFIHVSDLARVHVAALRYLESGGEPTTLNCGYGRGVSVLEVIRALEEVTGRAIPWVAGSRRLGDAPAVVADITKLHNTLSWSPRFPSIEEIVSSALEWEQRGPR